MANFVTNSQSVLTLQQLLDRILPLGDVRPVLVDVSGSQPEPFVTICSDVYSEIVGLPFPHKWNEIKLPVFYTNSWQQDYALVNPNGSSVYNVEWLERGIVVDMTSDAQPRTWGYVECGRQLTQATGTFVQSSAWSNPTFLANYFPNFMLYYGTWGASNSGGNNTVGNNPGPGSIYTNPLNASQNTQPNNPISQVTDTNGNLQVLTGYGTCGATQPNWPPANSAPGVNTPDGTCVWTVVDPNGVGIRILPVPSQSGTVYQFNLIAQQPAKRFDSLSDTLAPFPDKYEMYFRQGVIAQCYRYSPVPSIKARFQPEYMLWKSTLNDLRAAEDRELEENRFVPEYGIMARGGGYTSPTGLGWAGAAWPFPGGGY